jgi:hypothetical protein
MRALSEILESTVDDQECVVVFSNGDVFGLANFEMVDEGIYQRRDICVADIFSKINVKSKLFRVGCKFEFSVNDVIEVRSATDGEVLWPSARFADVKKG